MEKSVFILDLLEGLYRRFLQHIVVLCPKVYLLDPGERLHDYLRAVYYVFMGEPTLYIIDDCSAVPRDHNDSLSFLSLEIDRVELIFENPITFRKIIGCLCSFNYSDSCNKVVSSDKACQLRFFLSAPKTYDGSS